MISHIDIQASSSVPIQVCSNYDPLGHNGKQFFLEYAGKKFKNLFFISNSAMISHVERHLSINKIVHIQVCSSQVWDKTTIGDKSFT